MGISTHSCSRATRNNPRILPCHLPAIGLLPKQSSHVVGHRAVGIDGVGERMNGMIGIFSVGKVTRLSGIGKMGHRP